MQLFRKDIRVRQDDLDELNHVNNVRYVQWIQDISKAHWQALAPRSVQETVVWVVMRHDIGYKRAAKLNDILQIETHIEKSKGAISTRVVEIYNKASKTLLVRSQTDWCLLNAKTLKPTRITDDIMTIFHPKT